MKKRWTIRTAVPGDSDGLQQCMEAAYSPYRDRMGEARLPPLYLDYSCEINNFPVWVAEFENKIVGGIILTFEDDHASIANIAVHPRFQGQGLGRGFMTFAEGKAKENNYSELRLATHVLLTENVSLYRHLGWVEINRDDIRVYMKKEI